MNEQQMTALVERVGETLEPDVAALVAGGAARGRVRRRRRRTVGSVIAGVVAVGAVLAAVSVPSGSADVDVAASDLHVGVAADDMSTTLAGLLPGSRPATDDEPYVFQIRRGLVLWHGSRVSLSIDGRSVGTDVSAQERCRSVQDRECEQGPGGAWFVEHGLTTVDTRTGTESSRLDLVTVYEPDGHRIEAAGESGSPWIDRDLLRRIALDEVWLG